jgi:hypothetical protein
MMTAYHRLRCACGHFEGRVELAAVVNRGTCYCKDCQAFAHFLGRPERILDELGGSDIVQTLPQAVQFTMGMEQLACVRLTPNGLMRWYARCCNTPIGNTLSNYQMSFVGLLHACLVDPAHSLDESFGPSRMRVHTQSAAGDPKPNARGVLGAAVRLGGMMLKARLTGAYRRTPFFSTAGVPVVTPKILDPDELLAVMARCRGTAGRFNLD